MRVFLWLFAGPALALIAASLLSALTPGIALSAALSGQALAFPVWRRLERRPTALALRLYRRTRRGQIVRGRLSARELAAQVTLRMVGAILLAAAVLVVRA